MHSKWDGTQKMQEGNVAGKTQKALTIHFFEAGRENVHFPFKKMQFQCTELQWSTKHQ